MKNPLQRVETGNFIKAYHNLLNAHFDLRNYRKFEEDFGSFWSVFLHTKRVNKMKISGLIICLHYQRQI